METTHKVLFRQNGVFIHTTVAQANEDALIAGEIFVIKKPEGIFVQWKEDRKKESKSKEKEWTMVSDSISYKNDSKSDSEIVTMNQRSFNPKYVVDFEMKDLKCFKRSKPSLGWAYLIFILKCGTTYPALHFHRGGSKAFIEEMRKHLSIKQSSDDPCLYLTRDHDPLALSKSFDELQLFEKQQASDMLSKFIHDPYSATIGMFSKVPNYLKEALLASDTPEYNFQMAQIEEEVKGISVRNSEDSGFEIVSTQIDLPPAPAVKRLPPLRAEHWSSHMDDEGAVLNVDMLKEAIFKGGVDASIRTEVWKFLLGYYKWDSTYKSRSNQRKQKVDDYFRMKAQWKTISEDQESRFSSLRDKKSLVEKDVTRTDRTHNFFQGENNPNLSVLYDILLTYCMYNFDLGYVQGMSDLLAPILVVMENEVDAFWCFAGFLEKVSGNFEQEQTAMKTQLLQLQVLITAIDPQLANYLESHDSINMYFCFRWLLILFKREFSFPDIMRLWEVLWTDKPCKNFHLLICIAMLKGVRTVLMENNFGFTEILKHVNDMSYTVNVEDVLQQAESIYLQLKLCRSLPKSIHDILFLSDDDKVKVQSNSQTTDRHKDSISQVKVISAQPSINTNGRTNHSPSSKKLYAAGDGTGSSTTPDDSSIEILSDNNMV